MCLCACADTHRERATLIGLLIPRESLTPERRWLIREARPFTPGAREASPGLWLRGATPRVLVARRDAAAGKEASGAAAVAALGVMDGTPRWRLYNE